MTEDRPLDVSLEDTELLTEVDLLTDLIIAAQEARGRLAQARIDEVLRVPNRYRLRRVRRRAQPYPASR
jgi:hypothetical protein